MRLQIPFIIDYSGWNWQRYYNADISTQLLLTCRAISKIEGMHSHPADREDSVIPVQHNRPLYHSPTRLTSLSFSVMAQQALGSPCQYSFLRVSYVSQEPASDNQLQLKSASFLWARAAVPWCYCDVLINNSLFLDLDWFDWFMLWHNDIIDMQGGHPSWMNSLSIRGIYSFDLLSYPWGEQGSVKSKLTNVHTYSHDVPKS